MTSTRSARRARREARKKAKAAMKARRAAVAARLAQARAAAKSRPEARRAERQRRRRRRLALLALLLLLLLLRRCECDEPGIGLAPEPDVGVDAALIIADMGPDAAPPPKKTPRKRPIRARIDRKERPEFRNPPPPAADWLAALRIQVAARGPRLARCFEGSDRPGALEWRAVVDVARGVTSDHDFVPVLGGAQLGKALERCLTDVLSDPPYRLPAEEDAGRPRVSIIVEF